jgi:hypothetical protein
MWGSMGVNSVGGTVGALLDCDFLLWDSTFRVRGGIGGLLELLLKIHLILHKVCFGPVLNGNVKLEPVYV